ncbi:MAG: glycosyltransferase family 1 protein, partial [Coleofasciculaceae cyanobacterium]
MSQLKISIVTPTLSKGGVERAYLLAQALLKLNYQVEIIGFLFDNETVYPLPPEYLQVYSIPGSDYPGLFVAAKQLLEQLNGDIIYAVKPKVTSFGLALLKQLGKCPVILDIDDWEL